MRPEGEQLEAELNTQSDATLEDDGDDLSILPPWLQPLGEEQSVSADSNLDDLTLVSEESPDQAETAPADQAEESEEQSAELTPEQVEELFANPDNLDLANKTRAEREAYIRKLVEINPEAAVRYGLRLADHTHKTQQAAKQAAENERIRNELARERAELERQKLALYGGAPPTQKEAEDPEPSVLQGADFVKWGEWFERKYGREPTQLDLDSARHQQAIRAELGPLLQYGQEYSQQAQEEALRQTVARANQQWDNLVAKLPQANIPGWKEAVFEYLGATGSTVEPVTSTGRSAVEDAFWLLFGAELHEATGRGATKAREQQETSRRAAPAVPAASGPPTAMPISSSHEEIRRNLLRDPKVRAALGLR